MVMTTTAGAPSTGTRSGIETHTHSTFDIYVPSKIHTHHTHSTHLEIQQRHGVTRTDLAATSSSTHPRARSQQAISIRENSPPTPQPRGSPQQQQTFHLHVWLQNRPRLLTTPRAHSGYHCNHSACTRPPRRGVERAQSTQKQGRPPTCMAWPSLDNHKTAVLEVRHVASGDDNLTAPPKRWAVTIRDA